MQFAHEEYMLLSRRGSVPRALGNGPPREPPIEPEPVVIRRKVRRKSLLDSVLMAASMTRAMVVGVQEQRRKRP